MLFLQYTGIPFAWQNGNRLLRLSVSINKPIFFYHYKCYHHKCYKISQDIVGFLVGEYQDCLGAGEQDNGKQEGFGTCAGLTELGWTVELG